MEQAGNVINGRLALGKNRLVVDYDAGAASPIANIRKYLASGYAAGSWNGTGISSVNAQIDGTHHTGLGYAEASDVLGPNGGQFVDLLVDSSAVLVRYTLYGDSNLDGAVDLTDFTYLVSNFNGSGKSWLQGDYNYDGSVNLSDFTLLASNFNQTISAADATAAPSLGAAVPEPALGAPIILILALTLPSRRGKAER
jgi:hypothetical protein